MKRFLLLFTALFLYGTANFVQAETSELQSLLDILRDNGTLTQKQYDQLNTASETEGQKGAEETAAVEVGTKGGLDIATYDGSFSFEIGGRLAFDAAFYNQDKNELGDGTELRKAYLKVEGTVFSGWDYEFEIDFSNSEADVKDAYLTYNRFWPARITFGQFKEPFSLEELTTSKYITFMERALPNELAPGRSIGAGLRVPRETWTAAVGLFGEGVADDVDDEGDEGWAVTGRLTYSPIHSETRILHVGAAASYREPDSEKKVKFNVRPESHITDLKYADTGKMKNVDSLVRYGAEAAGVLGPLSLQGEYLLAEINSSHGFEDARFHGWYIYGSWFLTGESRPYKEKKGVFGRVKPRSSKGAVEAAIRYSTIDLSDASITGGETSNITFGLNWYINPQLRFMANYILIDNDDDADADGDVDGNDSPEVFQTRLQIDF